MKGQTIADAIHVLEKTSTTVVDRQALINIGCTDITNGITKANFAQSFKRLLYLCRERGITPHVASIMPRSPDPEDLELIRPFNEYLSRTVSNILQTCVLGSELRKIIEMYVHA